MAVDLSGLAVGTVWRVRTSRGDGILLVYNSSFGSMYLVHYDGGAGYSQWLSSGLDKSGIHRIESILHELKPVSDITAADLDGMVIETSDGGKVFFADGHAVLWDAGTCCLQSWRVGEGPEWFPHGEYEQAQAAYAAELERRRNPPVEVIWDNGVHVGNRLVAATCNIGDDLWRISYSGVSYSTYRNLDCVGELKTLTAIEMRIRDHYKDRATST